MKNLKIVYAVWQRLGSTVVRVFVPGFSILVFALLMANPAQAQVTKPTATATPVPTAFARTQRNIVWQDATNSGVLMVWKTSPFGIVTSNQNVSWTCGP